LVVVKAARENQTKIEVKTVPARRGGRDVGGRDR